MREQLSMCTARTNPKAFEPDPLPSGAVPEVTAEDIALAVAHAGDAQADALFANCTGSVNARHRMGLRAIAHGWQRWTADYAGRPGNLRDPSDPDRIRRVTVAALVEWTSPTVRASHRLSDETKKSRGVHAREAYSTNWSDAARARVAKVSAKQFARKYRAFYFETLNYLASLERSGDELAEKVLWG